MIQSRMTGTERNSSYPTIIKAFLLELVQEPVSKLMAKTGLVPARKRVCRCLQMVQLTPRSQPERELLICVICSMNSHRHIQRCSSSSISSNELSKQPVPIPQTALLCSSHLCTQNTQDWKGPPGSLKPVHLDHRHLCNNISPKMPTRTSTLVPLINPKAKSNAR